MPDPKPIPKDDKPRQFIYILRLVPRLFDDRAWTPADADAGSRHFMHLTAAADRGQVILAGRTDEPKDRTFGIVVFEASEDASARSFMESDPALVAGIMTAELHPYAVSVLRLPQRNEAPQNSNP